MGSKKCLTKSLSRNVAKPNRHQIADEQWEMTHLFLVQEFVQQLPQIAKEQWEMSRQPNRHSIADEQWEMSHLNLGQECCQFQLSPNSWWAVRNVSWILLWEYCQIQLSLHNWEAVRNISPRPCLGMSSNQIGTRKLMNSKKCLT